MTACEPAPAVGPGEEVVLYGQLTTPLITRSVISPVAFYIC